MMRVAKRAWFGPTATGNLAAKLDPVKKEKLTQAREPTPTTGRNG